MQYAILKGFELERRLRQEDIESVPELSRKRLDIFLKECCKYKYGIWDFSLSLYVIASFYTSYHLKNHINIIKSEIDSLVSLKAKFPFILNPVIKESSFKFPDGNFQQKLGIPVRKEYSTSALKKIFRLEHVYQIINKKIAFLKSSINYLERFGYKSRISKIRIESLNLTVLVWGLALGLERKGSHINDFFVIANLIKWFQRKTEWGRLFQWSSNFSDDTVKLTFFKYIKYRKRIDQRNKRYYYLAEWLRLNSFNIEDGFRSSLLPPKPEMRSSRLKGILKPSREHKTILRQIS